MRILSPTAEWANCLVAAARGKRRAATLSCLRCLCWLSAVALVIAATSAVGVILGRLKQRLALTEPIHAGGEQPQVAISDREDKVDSESAEASALRRVLARQTNDRENSGHLHRFNQTWRLPVLRLASSELESAAGVASRAEVGAAWARSHSAVFAATVRDAQPGLASTVANLIRLAATFQSAHFVFVEGDSRDDTRRFLIGWARRDPRVTVLGCGRVNSARPCRPGLAYPSTGRRHRPGWAMRRAASEKRDRGVLMSALRNLYLGYVRQWVGHATLLFVTDPDLTFAPWPLETILQGLYYFATRPRLDSLCAKTRFRNRLYDPCSLTLYKTRHFSEEAWLTAGSDQISVGGAGLAERLANYSVSGGGRHPPVKVASCYQAFAIYRLASLRVASVAYGPAEGEALCEHNTLSRHLAENYLDVNMELEVVAQNEGGS